MHMPCAEHISIYRDMPYLVHTLCTLTYTVSPLELETVHSVQHKTTITQKNMDIEKSVASKVSPHSLYAIP